MMYVKLFSTLDIATMEKVMNEFINDYDKGDIVSVDVKLSTIYDQANQRPTLYYTGIVTYDEPRM